MLTSIARLHIWLGLRTGTLRAPYQRTVRPAVLLSCCVALLESSSATAQTEASSPQPTSEAPATQTESTSQSLKIEETQVTGEREHHYRVQEATTTTKTDTPLRDIPQSIQVIDRQVIEDRQVVRLSKVADNVSGVQYASGYGGLSSSDYYIRGFSTFGIVYQPIYPTSLYFSWSNSFNPQIFSLTQTEEPFKPEQGEQFEFGIKQELLENQVWAALAFYEITKANVLTTDPDDPDFSIQTGEQRSRGIEFDMTGRLLPGWNVIATYAYTDARITEDNTLRVGSRLAAIPEHAASWWSTYEFQHGRLQGFGGGVGIYYASNREATLPNTIHIPSYWRADASLFYRHDRWKVQLNFKNLFDEKYYDSQGFFVIPQAPLSVLGTVTVEF